jgi:hypothetical protein
MVKMYRITVEPFDAEDNPRVYIVGKEEKDFLLKALSEYKVQVEEFIVNSMDL